MSDTEVTTIPKLRRVFYNTYANLPVTGLASEDLGYATDQQILYRWNGAAWQAITTPSNLSEIGDTTLAVDTASVSFNSFSGYAFLLLLWHRVRCSHVDAKLTLLTFNDDAAANYIASRQPWNAATNFGAASNIPLDVIGDSDGGVFTSTGHAFIFNRAAVYKYLQGIHINSDVSYCGHSEGLWNNAAAEIIKITLTPAGGNFLAGSRFILMGSKT